MRAEVRYILIAFGIFAVFFLWLGLSAAHQTFKAVEVIRTYLPPWFPAVNLLLAPLLIGLAAAASGIRLEIRFFTYTLALCSLSALYLSYERYPAISVAVVLLIYLEVYWIVPKWNARRRAAEGRAPEPPPVKSTATDYVIYLAIAFAIAGWLIYKVMARQ